MQYNLKARIERMMNAWTENNDGIELPSNMNASQHSGDATMNPLEGASLDAEILKTEKYLEELMQMRGDEVRPVHVWTSGLLPGAVKIRSCAGDASHAAHWERV
jgi:hypothetical protein